MLNLFQKGDYILSTTHHLCLVNFYIKKLFCTIYYLKNNLVLKNIIKTYFYFILFFTFLNTLNLTLQYSRCPFKGDCLTSFILFKTN